jgi:hypothetical protein
MSPYFLLRLLNSELGKRLHPLNPDGIDIISADWDNMLLMDACRYDMFEERVDIPGTLEKVESKGSMTIQFLEGNFDGRDATDIVYVTANPMLRRIEADNDFRFHRVIDVWADQGWDEQYGTVLPATMLDAALDAMEQYPDKRILVHFMQPHFPFIADTTFDKKIPDPEAGSETQFWGKLRQGTLSLDPAAIWEPYNKNLDEVAPILRELADEFEGKTVITSDHGNMIGERARPIPVREWGHPRAVYTPELVEVPWLTAPFDRRRETTKGDATAADDTQHDDDVVKDRLRHLGYTEP